MKTLCWSEGVRGLARRVAGAIVALAGVAFFWQASTGGTACACADEG